MAIHHKPVMLCPTCYVQGIYRTKVSCYQRVSPRCLCVSGGGGGGGGAFYCTPEAASFIKGVIFCWDIRGNYAFINLF